MHIHGHEKIQYSAAVTRSIRISLVQATAAKKGRLAALLRELRCAANFYAESLWETPGKLDAKTHARYQNGSLGYSHKTEALKQALQAVVTTRKAAKALGVRKISCPVFRRAIRLSALTCHVQPGKDSFDFVLKISSLSPGNRIIIPFKSHKRLNHWLDLGGKIKDGAIVTEKYAWLFIEVPDAEPKTEGEEIGLDVGLNKLITDSNGNVHGTGFKDICAAIRRKKPGSFAKRRARHHRYHYINFVCRRLPWQTTKTFVLEDLTGLKVGKGNRGKRNRKLLAPWSYRQVRTRLTQLAQENRVRLEFVNPHGTSRTCPSCGLESAKNRVGELFQCLRCHYTADADYIGARNILAKTTRTCPESKVPVAVCGT